MINATFLLRYYARKRGPQLAAEDPVAAQSAVLKALLAMAANTRFGRDHGFSTIGTPEEFRALLISDVKRWGKVVKDAGIKVE